MRDLILNSSMTVILKVISALIKFGLVIVVTNLYGAEEYGAFTFSMSIFLFANMIFRYGFDIHLHKRIAEKFYLNNKLSCQRLYVRLATISMISIIIFSIALRFTLPFLVSHDLLNLLKFEYLNSILIYGFIYSGFWLAVYYYRGLNRAKLSVFVLEIIFPTLNILLIYVFNYFDFGAPQVLINAFGISVLISFIFLLRLDRLKLSLFLRINYLKLPEYSKFEIIRSAPFLFISASGMLMSWVDFYIISFFQSDEEIGIYSVATKIALFLLFPASAISIFFSNKIVEFLKTKEENLLSSYLKRITIILFASSLLFFLIINLFNKEILGIFGEEFIEATVVLFILSFAHMLNAATGMYETVILMSPSKKHLFKLNLITVLINLILNIPLVYYYGLEGAAIGTLIAIVANRAFQYRIIKKMIL